MILAATFMALRIFTRGVISLTQAQCFDKAAKTLGANSGQPSGR
jgi:hypothetical protein